MAGYLGTKAVLLSTTAANVVGNATIGGDLTVDTDTLYVDSTNNQVGIGTTSPSASLHVNADASAAAILVTSSNTGNADIIFGGQADLSRGDIRYENSTDSMRFSTNNKSEAMRIDSTGNLLVGKTSADAGASAGVEATSSGKTYLTRDTASTTASVLDVNKKTGDGTIIAFRKDGTTVGSIGVQNGDNLRIGGSVANHAGLQFGTNIIYPESGPTSNITDGIVDLGSGSGRFNDIYATNATIQTSDRNEKQDIASLTPTEMLVAARLSTGFKNFKWKDAVAEKGAAARIHSGAISQDVQDAFTAEGLDAGDYSMFISGTWWTHDVDVPAVEAVAEVVDEDGVVVTEAVEAVAAYTRTDTYDTEAEAPVGAVSKTRLGVRYTELLSFVAAYNEQRFASIEARLTVLEAV